MSLNPLATWSKRRSTRPSTRPLQCRTLSIEQLEERITPALIDPFSTVPPHTVSQTGQGTITSSLGGLSGVLGGSREITIVNNGPNIAQNTTAVEINQSSSNAFDQNQTRPGSTTITRWDGNANGSLDATGLGGIDFTNGGTQNAIRLGVLIDDLAFTLRMRVYTSATRYSDATLNLPGGIYTLTGFTIPFSSFTTGSGASSAATLSNVGAIEMIVDGTAVALDLQLDFIDVVGLVDLSVGKTVNTSTPAVGDVVTYSVAVSNRNSSSLVGAVGVQVTDLLPAGVTYVSHNAPGTTTYNPNTGLWDLSSITLAPGATSTLTIQARVDVTTTVTNYAEVTRIGTPSNPQIDTDSTPGNNSTNEDDDDSIPVTATQLDFGDAPDTYGTTIAANGARHANSGPRLGSLRDTESNGVPTADASGDGADEDGVTISQIGLGSSLVLPITVTANGFLNAWFDLNRNGTFEDSERLLTNVALTTGSNLVPLTVPAGTPGASFARFRLTTGTVASPSPLGYQSTGEVEDYAITLVAPADLQLAKTVDNSTPDLGQQIVYTLTLDNTSVNQATGVTVRDLLPAGLTFVSATGTGTYTQGTGIWDVGTLNGGATATLNIRVTVVASGSINNYAEVRTLLPGDSDSVPGNNSTTEDDDASVTITVPNVDFGDAPNSYGTTLASNGARHNATGVTLGSTRDSENDGSPGAAANGDGADEDGVTGIANLLPGAGNTITLTSVGAGFVNAWIDYNQNGVFDPSEQVLTNFAINGTASPTINVPVNATLGTTYARFRITSASVASPSPTGLLLDGEVEDYRVQIARQANLSLTKIVDNATPLLGDTVSYTITVSNAGPNPATNLTVRDQLPAGVAYVSDNSASTSTTYASNIWNIGTLASGSSIQLIIQARVIASGSIANYAQVQSVTEFDPNSTPGDNSTTDDDDDTVSITVAAQDFGDAPDTYGTLLASNGARHIATGVTLGSSRDSENDGSPGAAANGDGADENGVTGIATLAQDASNTITLTSVGAGFVNAWIDYNQNGVFDPSEQVLTNFAINGTASPTINVPVNATLGTTYARFRITSASVASPSPTGLLPDGEVEDYRVIIQRQANVSLTKIVDNATPLLGDTVSYTITVSNAGPNPATNLTVRDQLPAGLAYVSDNSASTSTTYASNIWNIGTLASGSNIQLIIQARVIASGSIANYAQVQTLNEVDPNSTPGNNSTTEDDDDTVSITVAAQDFGDAPDTYGTLIASNGARHVATGVTLGNSRDSEANGQPTTAADGDGADENGVTFGTLTLGASGTLNLTSTGAGFVNAWIDYNQNGVFEPGEQVLTNFAINGSASPSINLPGSALGGLTYARFRITSASVASPSPTGLLPDGEVEDYRITLTENFDYGDLPASYGTLRADDGARHVVVSGAPYMGNLPDVDSNGQPTVAADGDDTTGSSDENGVGFGTLIAGQSAIASVFAPIGGRLNAWIDFNGNGTFEAGEQITPNAGTVLNSGFTTIPFTLPAGVVAGTTYARFRISTAGNLGPTGFAADGEVEDYRVTIESVLGSIGNRLWEDRNGNGIQDGSESGLANVDVTARWAGPNGTFDDGDDQVFSTTTNGTGDYLFAGLQPGSYRITVDTADLPSHFIPTYDLDGGLDSVSVVTVAVQQNRTDVDFGYRGTASIAGRVYVDGNNNGVYEPGLGETGIGNVTLTLTGTDANGAITPRTTTTASDGTYSFTRLLPGTYTVTETQASGYADGLDTRGTVNGTPTGTASNDVISGILVDAGQTGINYNFGERTAGSIRGIVYLDANRNGVREAADGGIGGVTLTLLDATGAIVGTTTSSILDGSYEFTGIPGGTYTIIESQPPTHGSSTPNQRTGVTVAPNAATTGQDFGETLGSLTGIVYFDANNNGLRDGNEPGIVGTTVTLTGTDAAGVPVIRTASTSTTGIYTFDRLPAGTYTLTETQPTGFADGLDRAGTAGGTAGNDVTTGIVLGAGQDATGYLFGERGTVLSGIVYLDANRNRVYDAGDSPLAGVPVLLRDAAGQALTLAYSDPTGYYSFTGLLPGRYTLDENQPTGYGSSTPNTIPVLLPATGLTNQNFGETLDGFVSGVVFLDADRNGVLSPTEGRLSGVTLTLRNSAGTTVRTTTSGPDGSYLFTGLVPGTYSVVETQPGGYDSTTPNTLTFNVPVTGIANRNFGEALPIPPAPLATLTGKVFLDLDNNGRQDPGEPGIAGTRVQLTGTSSTGATIVRAATTAVDGSYQFIDLPSSNGTGYTLTETQPTGYNDGIDTAGSLGGTAGNDVISGVVIVAGQTGTAYNFAEQGRVLAGTVYRDADRDTLRDPLERGIGGVLLELRNSAGQRVATTTTGPDGAYRFTATNLPAGNYSIVETQPAGYGSSTPNTINVTLGATGSQFGLDFGETTSSLAGLVFKDLNINASRQAGEGVIAGVQLTLTGTDANGVQVKRSTVTSAAGTYLFDDLLSGNYTITETQPAGYYQGLPHAAGTAGATSVTDSLFTGIALGAAVDGTGYNFGEIPPADPFGYVYHDRNANGRKDAGEPGIAGVLIRLSGTAFAGTPLATPVVASLVPGGLTRITAADGFYHFSIMPPGVYSLTETQPTAYLDGRESSAEPLARSRLSSPVVVGNDVFRNIVLEAIDPVNPASGRPDVRGAFDFGELRRFNLSGFVFRDNNNDGVRQGSEPLLARALVRLIGTDDLGRPVNRTVYTDARGAYRFTDLRPSNASGYTLTVVPPAGSGLRVGKTRGPRGTFTLGRISQIRFNQTDRDLTNFSFALLGSDKFIL